MNARSGEDFVGNVLVVDDDELVGSALSQSLRREGFVVDLATNVDEALNLFNERRVDVVLTDLIMPGGTGLDLLRHIELRDPMVPVIIITADDSVQPAAEAVRERAFDYLTKPVSRQRLSAAVGRAVEARRQGELRRREQERLRADHKRLAIQNKRRSMLLSVLFSRAVEAIIIWDEQGNLVDASDSFVALVGSPLYALNKSSIDELFEPHPSEGAVSRRILALSGTTRTADHWRGDVVVRAAGSRRLPARLSLSVCEMPGTDVDESWRYVVGLLYYERAHEELSRQLQQADRLATIGLLAGSAAHEIKNDLGPLLGYLSLLPDDGNGMIEIMQDSVRRIQEHVEEILAPLRPRIRTRGAVVLSKSVEGILDFLRRAGRLRRLKLQLELDEGDVVVHADKDEVHQIGLNLITNALDALGDGGGAERGTITIRVFEETPYGVLQVTDDGSGIPEDVRSRVFEPFFTTKADGGTGLGLPVVHDIVRNLRGKVELTSEEGEGTTVTIRVPLYRPDGN